jgi:LysM repeat protein
MIQIARCYGANFTEVRNANLGIPDADIISIDTIITVPKIGSAGKIYGPPCVGTHTVQSGDTWASIAQRYNADVVVLQAANSSSSLAVGSVIKIPLNSSTGIIYTPAPVAAATLTPTVTPTATTQANPTDAVRITFPQGTTSATIPGTLNGQAGIRYVITGNQGQNMTINIVATPVNEIAWAVLDPGGVAIRQLDANTTWTGLLPTTGDYRIELSGIGTNNKTYTLTVSIVTP